LAALSESLREQKVLSIYLDGRTTDPASRTAWRSLLETELAALRHKVEGDHDDRKRLDRCIALLEERLATIAGALSAPGFVAFVATDGVAIAEPLPVVMPNVVTWQNGPFVSPYLRAQKELRPVVLGVVDARSARSYRYAVGALSSIQRFHAHAHVDQPTHMGASPRRAFHPGTRGATTTDSVERARLHGTQRMLHELIEHLVHEAAADEWILIGGTATRVDGVIAMLPAAARRRATVAPGLSRLTSGAALRRAAADAAQRLRQQLDDQIVESALSHAAEHGRGSVGAQVTREALSERAVHTLLFSLGFMNAHPAAAEELTRLALDGGAGVEIVTGSAAERLDGSGGVAAVLRFVVPTGPSPAGGGTAR
jgi:hypothetical protein